MVVCCCSGSRIQVHREWATEIFCAWKGGGWVEFPWAMSLGHGSAGNKNGKYLFLELALSFRLDQVLEEITRLPMVSLDEKSWSLDRCAASKTRATIATVAFSLGLVLFQVKTPAIERWNGGLYAFEDRVHEERGTHVLHIIAQIGRGGAIVLGGGISLERRMGITYLCSLSWRCLFVWGDLVPSDGFPGRGELVCRSLLMTLCGDERATHSEAVQTLHDVGVTCVEGKCQLN